MRPLREGSAAASKGALQWLALPGCSTQQNVLRPGPLGGKHTFYSSPEVTKRDIQPTRTPAGKWSGCCSPLLLQHQVLSMWAQSKTLHAALACWWGRRGSTTLLYWLTCGCFVPAPQPGHVSKPNAPEASLILGFVDGEKRHLKKMVTFSCERGCWFLHILFKKHTVSKETFIPLFLFSNFLVQSLFSEVPTWSFLLPASFGIFLSLIYFLYLLKQKQ